MSTDFYERCGELLGIDYTPVPWPSPTRGPNRWNNRHAGNGRFEGFGIIRRHSTTDIHVVLRRPLAINKRFKSEDDVFALLRSIKEKQE